MMMMMMKIVMMMKMMAEHALIPLCSAAVYLSVTLQNETWTLI